MPSVRPKVFSRFTMQSGRDVSRATLVVTALALLASWLITAILVLATGAVTTAGLLTAALASTLAPLLVAAPLSHRNFRLIWQLHQSRQEIERLSQIDELTQTYNRRDFMEMARRELALAARHGYAVALLLLDLDDFKRINDQMGHLAGDQALADCAALIHNTIRQGDVLGRFGGDEFLVLAPHTGQTSAARLAERIRRAMAGADLRAAGQPVSVSISVGVVSTEQGPADADELLRRADQALYRAKELGGDRTELAA